MATLRDKRDPIRLLFRRLGLLAVAILVVAAGIGDWHVYKKERESKILRTEAEFRASDLSQQAAVLSSNLEKLKTDRGKEESLRDSYNMGRAGEGLIVIIDPASPPPVQATSTILDKLKRALPWW